MRYLWRQRLLMYCTFGRVFLPMLLMICAEGTNRYASIWAFTRHEAVPMTLTAILGISNGFCGSVPMIRAPTKVKDSQREIAGMYVLV